jgi:uncharacterized protein (DUF1697 family)
MKTYIAFLRGINVGGHRKILMADLKKLLITIGFENVTTYIQSGNVVFSANEISSFQECEMKIEKQILEHFGFDVPVIIRSKEEIQNLLFSNPFLQDSTNNPERFFVTFLSDFPSVEQISLIEKFDFSPDKFKIGGKDIFLYCPGNYSDTKLSNKFFESKLEKKATSRNWKTVLKMLEIAEKSH